MGSTCDLVCEWLFICWVVNNDDLLSCFHSDKSELNTQLATCHFVTEMVPDVISVSSGKYEFVTLNKLGGYWFLRDKTFCFLNLDVTHFSYK